MRGLIANHLILYFYPILGLVMIPVVNYNYFEQLSKSKETVASTFLCILCMALFLFLFCWFLYRLSVQKVSFHSYSVLISAIGSILLVIAPLQRKVSFKFWTIFYSDTRYHLLLAFMILSVYSMIFVAKKHAATGK